MSLFDATRHLHHACEEHSLGQAMIHATITSQQWCDWLGSLRLIHEKIDPHLPPLSCAPAETV